MTLPLAIHDALQRFQTKVVCRDPETELTGGQFLRACRAAATRLSAPEVSPAVGLLLPNSAAYAAALFGVLWAGRRAVPLNPMLKPNEIAFLLQDAGINTVVVAPATRALVSGLSVHVLDVQELLQPGEERIAPAEGTDDDTAIMLYTSGTSGKPKGVPLTHKNVLSNAQSLIHHAHLTERDAFLGVLPMFHAFGLTGTLVMPLLLGAEATYLPRFVPDRVAATMAERSTSVFVAVPGMFGLLVRIKEHEAGIRNLTYPVCGGEALPSTIREAFEKRFDRPLFEGYGLTETAPVIAVNVPGANRAGTVGKAVPGVQVRIADEKGQALPVGDEGEIQVHGPNVTRGYYQRPEENAVTFTGDGWFRTGDLGRLDREGFLTISGRIKEIIIRAGEKIMPREVEEVLSRFPGVQEAAVIGEPDGDRGEAVSAFVVPVPGQNLTPEALREHCRGRLADFKIPRRFTIASDLPRGATGKLLKRALKEYSGGK